ncbi:histone-lysine N-methyltransferase SUVR4-like isoform X2 [Pistacia vera]|nr:histone-lysine N-methyltransferase SUVR4-like isoform X2 [Pistacia vera]
MVNSSQTLPLEEDEMPKTNSRHGIMESPWAHLMNRRTASKSVVPNTQLSCKRKERSSSLVVLRDRKSTQNGESAICSKQPLDAHGCSHRLREITPDSHCVKKLIKPKTDLPVGKMAHVSEPIPVVHPVMGSSTGNHNEDDTSACSGSTSCKRNLEIASSAMGEVKLSLNYNFPPGEGNSRGPNIDAVLKHLEHKYLRLDKIVGPQFSVKKLLKDLCDSFSEVHNKFTSGSGIKHSSHEVYRNVGDHCSATGKKKKGSKIVRSETDLSKKVLNCSGSSNSSNLANQQLPVSRDKKKPIQSISDITKGAENVKISLVDDTGNENLPKFTYIPHNIVYQNAYVHISLARIADEDCCSSCSGDCLSFSIPCACARETGGEFAYTPQGLLKEEFLRACMQMEKGPLEQHLVYCQDCPIERSKNEHFPEKCKGHIVRKFIKECWRKCGCSMQCGNRVVQRGITCKLQVFLTDKEKGWGVRTLQNLPKGAFVCEYVGEVVTNTELYERNMQSDGNERHTYPVTLDADWGSERVLQDEEALCLDATFRGNVARFINHRCFDANLIDIPVEVETPDRHYYHLALFTTREVSALEELTWDYGIDFSDHDHPIKAFQCCCGSAFCRDITQNS